MKSKFVFGLLAVMVVLALAPSSFAQLNVQIFNTPSPIEIKTNRTAETSDPLSAGAGITVSGSLVANSNLSTTNLLLTFPAGITVGATNLNDVPAGDAIRLLGATGAFAAATIVSRSLNTLTISLIGPADLPGNTLSGSFRIVGTRIDVNGLTAPVNATATLSSSATNFILSTTSFPVITALGDGIASVKQDVMTGGTNPGPLIVFTNKTAVNATTNILLTEGFAFAWRSATQNKIDSPTATGVGSTQIRLTFANIPATSTITLSATSSTGTLGAITNPVVSSTTTTAYLTWTGNTGPDPAVVDQIQLTAVITAPTSNPAVSSITVTASMFPTRATFGTGGVLVTGSADPAGGTTNPPVPGFLAAESTAATIGNIIQASTTMLVPLVMKFGAYDTGLSIANTTADPFGLANGGATPTAGSITFSFFPRTATGAGSPFTLTTSSTVRPGGGLATDGTLAAGGTWSGLMSELLAAAGQTGDFTGYLFIQTNFPLAHGMGTISDFKTYSLATTMLVLNPTATAGGNRTTLTAGVERLGP